MTKTTRASAYDVIGTNQASVDAAAKKTARRAGRAERELISGPDTVRRVGNYVRLLARIEASTGGKFREALDARPEVEQWGDVAREVFGEFYGFGTTEVAETEAPAGSTWVRKMFEEASALPEWHEAKTRAEGDAWATGLCAAATLASLKFELPAPEKSAAAVQDQVDFLEGVMNDEGMTSPAHLRRLGAARKALAEATAQDQAAADAIGSNGSAIRDALRKALAPALEEIRTAQAAMEGLGGGRTAGKGLGNGLRVVGPTAELRAALARSPKLARVAKLAGRLRATAAQKQRTRTQYAREELADVSAGSDVSRLLPSELMMLGDEDTEALLYRRLLEGSALQYELRGKEKLQEGPIVMALDESGSMRGSRDEWSKACAIALIEVAARQNRPVALVHFDGAVRHVDIVNKPRAGVAATFLAEMAERFSGGGTDIAAALDYSIGLVSKFPEGKTLRKADIILVSDGLDGSRTAIEASIASADKAGIAIHGLAIGARFPSWMKLASTTEMDDSDLCGSTEKVHTIFSI